MNEKEPDFESLRKLLALKQHEVPPPGYFNAFSDQVVSRIRLGETAKAESFSERLFVEAPWILKIIQAFQAKPAFAGVFASALCLLLVAGIVYTDNPGAIEDPMMPGQVSENNSTMTTPMAAGFLAQSTPQGDMVSSTNPVLSLDPSASPFGAPNPLLQTVSFSH